MEELDPGHKYSMNVYSPYNDGYHGQEPDYLQFVKKIGDNFPNNKGNPQDGTSSQEVIRVLVARAKYLQGQIPCRETESIIYYLRRALFAFELRTARIKKAKLPEDISLDNIERFSVCPSCGHIYLHDFGKCRK